MGRARDYSCAKCGYEVKGMVSGYDVGMRSHVVAIRCEQCRALHVVVLPGSPWEEQGERLGEMARRGELPPGVACPRNKKHHVSLWTHPGPCPRCGHDPLVRGEGLLMWD